MTCIVDTCDRPARSRGWCITHYRRWRAHGDPLTILTDRGKPAEVRFLNRIEKLSNSCWRWTTGTNDGGYGRFCPSRAEGNYAAHRWAYLHFVGPIPDGYTIDHICHNNDPGCTGRLCEHRLCVNPEHLEAVPLRTNLFRSDTPAAINAAKTRCPADHPYDESNTYIYKGMRSCRTCHREKERIRRLNRS